MAPSGTVPAPAGTVPPLWAGIIDDAAVFPPGNAALPEAIEAFGRRREEWYADLVGSLVLRDTDLGQAPADVPLSVVLTGGAGAVEGVVRLAQRRGLALAGLETALRDPEDPVGNARRVAAAVAAAGLDDDVAVSVEIPGPADTRWLRAADEVAAHGFRLKLRCGHVDHDLIPDAGTVAGWLDAALDRETPVKGTAGLHRAVRHDPEGGGAHGFLNLLVATRALLDGASADDAATILDSRDAAALAATDLGGIRTWVTGFGSCSVREPLDDLIALDLLEQPAHD